jgi:hypothetical protein
MRIVLFALVLAACGSSKPAPGVTATKFDPDAPLPVSCKASDECALVDACCGCNAGGKQIAIRADAVAGFQGSREQRCGGQMCAQVISTDASCDAEATCGQNGRCNVTPHMQSN